MPMAAEYRSASCSKSFGNERLSASRFSSTHERPEGVRTLSSRQYAVPSRPRMSRSRRHRCTRHAGPPGIERAHALRVAAFERCHSFFETMREMRSNGRIRSVPRESAYTANVSPRRKSTLFTTCTRYWKSDRSSFRPSLCCPIAWRTARGMLVNRRLLRSEVTLSNE